MSMTISPLGRRLSVYKTHKAWAAIYFVTDSAPTRAAAEAAADAFETPYRAGWIDALRDLWALWVAAKAVDAAGWNVFKFTGWLRGAVGRLAPGIGA
jgi:hypothetical protein